MHLQTLLHQVILNLSSFEFDWSTSKWVIEFSLQSNLNLICFKSSQIMRTTVMMKVQNQKEMEFIFSSLVDHGKMVDLNLDPVPQVPEQFQTIQSI